MAYKVLHIIGGDMRGGAAIGAYWLHLALLSRGVDSKILTNSPWVPPGDEKIISTSVGFFNVIINRLRRVYERLLLIGYPKKSKVIFSSAEWGGDVSSHQVLRDADIVHFHWINGGFVSIEDVSRIRKPIIWTLRDMWPLTGGCHVAPALGCNRYYDSCGRCPQLTSNNENDISKRNMERKFKNFHDEIYLVAMSTWMQNEINKTKLFHSNPTFKIANGIRTDDFFPNNKNDPSKNGKFKILVGGYSNNVFYKGFDKLIAALDLLDPETYELRIFGMTSLSKVKNLKIQTSLLGTIKDVNILRSEYSNADVFVSPSLFESFGKTVAEAMCCGTPVVCFATSGYVDIVDHKVNGYLAACYNTTDLAEGIKWVVCNSAKYKLSENARKKILSDFDHKKIADQYIKLYEKIHNGAQRGE